MATVRNPHPHDYGRMVESGVPLEEAVGATFLAGDLVIVASGRINKFVDTVAANALQLAWVNSNSKNKQQLPNKSHWPAGRKYMSERGHIVYAVTADAAIVMSLEGNAPADIQTLIGLKRDIAYVAGAFNTVMIKSTSANPRIQIIGIIEGVNNEPNPLLLCRPLMDADNWFGL